jgi:hypothetical protein
MKILTYFRLRKMALKTIKNRNFVFKRHALKLLWIHVKLGRWPVDEISEWVVSESFEQGIEESMARLAFEKHLFDGCDWSTFNKNFKIMKRRKPPSKPITWGLEEGYYPVSKERQTQ